MASGRAPNPFFDGFDPRSSRCTPTSITLLSVTVAWSRQFQTETPIVLELAFATRVLRALCEDEVRAAEELGDNVAKALRTRVADLRAASHPLDIPVGQPRLGTGVDAEHVFIELSDGYRLVLRCNHPKAPRSQDGMIAWNQVDRVQILRIEVSNE